MSHAHVQKPKHTLDLPKVSTVFICGVYVALVSIREQSCKCNQMLRGYKRCPESLVACWRFQVYWCLISRSMFSCLLRQVMGRTWVLLVIALQTPASKLPRTPQPPPHPHQEPSRLPATSDEDRTTMYRASTPTGAELLSHPQCNTHRQGYRRFEHENWIRKQIKEFYCV